MSNFRTFGEHEYITQLQEVKLKQDPSALLVRFLFQPDKQRNEVVVPATCHLRRCRIVNYLPYNPEFDPETQLYKLESHLEVTKAPVNSHHVIPCTALDTKTKVVMSRNYM